MATQVVCPANSKVIFGHRSSPGGAIGQGWVFPNSLTHSGSGPILRPRLTSLARAFRAERSMPTLRFQNRFAIALVSFSLASAILFSAFTLPACAQDPPKYRVDP